MGYDKKTAEDYLKTLDSMEKTFADKSASPEAGGNLNIKPVLPNAKTDQTMVDSGKKR